MSKSTLTRHWRLALLILGAALALCGPAWAAGPVTPYPLGSDPSGAEQQLDQARRLAAEVELNSRDAQARTAANLKAAQDMGELGRKPVAAQPDLMPSPDQMAVSPAADARSRAAIAANLARKR